MTILLKKVEIESQLMSWKNKKGASQNERPSVPKWWGAQPFFPNPNPRSVFNDIRVYPIKEFPAKWIKIYQRLIQQVNQRVNQARIY